MLKLSKLISGNFVELILLAILLTIGLSLRLYQLQDGFGFFGDQGRDLLAVLHWVTTGQLPLLGPLVSVGNFHLGPFYYYLIAPTTILFQFNPIGPVIFNLLCGLLLIFAAYVFLKKFADISGSFIAAFLISTSPHLILLSRSSWNPNPEPLFTVLFLYFFMKLIKTGKIKFIFIIYLILGIGVQLHYTFAVNILAAIVLVILFRPKLYLNYQFYWLSFVGFVIPLLPFIIGQFQNGFADVNYLIGYLGTSSDSVKTAFPVTITNRLLFPFDVFYPLNKIPDYLSTILKFLEIILLLSISFIAFTKKNRLSLVTRVMICYFLFSLSLTAYMTVPLESWYYQSFNIVVILLISNLISYLYLYVKIKYLWIAPFAIFVWWQIYLLPEAYKIARAPEVVEQSSELIINEISQRSSQGSISIMVLSPVTLQEGYEYRFFLERKGYKTHTASILENPDFLVFENSEKRESREIVNSEYYKKIADLSFDDFGNRIKVIKIYKKQK